MSVAVQNNREAMATVGAAPNMLEAVRPAVASFRGQTVAYRPENAKIAEATGRSDFRGVAARSDLASLSLRMLKQGQATSLRATPRVVDYFEKLPNMPQMAALQDLVDLFLSYEARGAPVADPGPSSDAEDATAQGIADSARQEAAALEEGIARVDRGGEEGAGQDGEGQGGEGRGGEGGGAREALVARILTALQQTDADITHQFATLDILRDYFAEAGAGEELQEALAAAALTFDQPELMRDIRAGFAAAQIAQLNAATLATSPALVREAYRQMLREKRNYGQLFDLLAKFDLLKKLETTIETFRTAAARDLAGLGRSPDQGFLEALLNELGKLKRVVTVLQLCEEVVANMRRLVAETERPLLEPAGQAAIGVASRMLNFAARATISLNDARALLEPLQAASLASRVAYVNALCILHKWLPDEILPSSQARLQQHRTLATLQSNLVEEEEAAYRNGGGA